MFPNDMNTITGFYFRRERLSAFKRAINGWCRRHKRTFASHLSNGSASKKKGRRAESFAESTSGRARDGALERREWPRTEAEFYLLRSAMFAAQTIVRDMGSTGREEEIEQIGKNISEVAPELPNKLRHTGHNH